MRRLLLFIMLFPLALYAQEDYKPLLKEGRTWNYTYFNLIRQYGKSQTIQGDTLIGGTMWKKVYSGGQYEKALREDGRKVYMLANGQPADSQQLLFDFGLQIGERQYFAISEGDVRYLEVTGIDHITSEGREYRVMRLKQVAQHNDETVSSDDCYWIEGIGGECGIEQPCQWIGLTGYTCLFKSCYDNEECIFMSPYAGLSVPTADKQAAESVYNLQGLITNRPSKGIYIQGGRKRVVK